MAAGQGSAKSNQRNKNQAIAQRLAHLRNAKFVTKGFGSNERVPTMLEARKMAGYNLRLINEQKPQPSVRQR